MAKQLYVCEICEHWNVWSDDDLQAKMECEPFAPCGHDWNRPGWSGSAVARNRRNATSEKTTTRDYDYPPREVTDIERLSWSM